jgi:hypothetical protein
MLLVLRERANGGDANEVRGLADSAWNPPHRFRGANRSFDSPAIAMLRFV